MPYKVRGPAQDKPAEIETIQSFVRIYPGPSSSVMAGADGDPVTPSVMVLEAGVEEEIVASGGPSSRIRVPASAPMPLVSERDPASPGRTVHPAAAPTSAAAVPSEYDRMDTRQMTVKGTGAGPSPRLSDSLMGQLREAGNMPMMEYYAEGYRQAGASGGYYQPPIAEAVLVFALTWISEDAERTVNAADVIPAKWTDSEAEVADLRGRLQRSELTASALLDSLQNFQNTSYEGKKRPHRDRGYGSLRWKGGVWQGGLTHGCVDRMVPVRRGERYRRSEIQYNPDYMVLFHPVRR
jgi:hypothetical protein